MVKRNNSQIVKNSLNNSSLPYEIFIDDIQRAINEESPPVVEDELLGRQG